jgi:hypothetical protein
MYVFTATINSATAKSIMQLLYTIFALKNKHATLLYTTLSMSAFVLTIVSLSCHCKPKMEKRLRAN